MSPASPSVPKARKAVGDGLRGLEIGGVVRRRVLDLCERGQIRIHLQWAVHESRRVPADDGGFGAEERRVDALGRSAVAVENADLADEARRRAVSAGYQSTQCRPAIQHRGQLRLRMQPGRCVRQRDEFAHEQAIVGPVVDRFDAKFGDSVLIGPAQAALVTFDVGAELREVVEGVLKGEQGIPIAGFPGSPRPG